MTVLFAGAWMFAAVASSTSAQMLPPTWNYRPDSDAAVTETNSQYWMAGWDNFTEPLDFAESSVTWRVSGHARDDPSKYLTVAFALDRARPSKLYQVGMHFFNVCANGNPPKKFGQFPMNLPCITVTRQGVTATVVSTEVGVVTTDAEGSGAFEVTIGPVKSGTYEVEFDVRDGAGCALHGGKPNHCSVDFQSPGPFGTTTAVRVP